MKKIKLTKGRFALVDDADYEAVSKLNWYAKKGNSTTYARHETWSGGKAVASIFMHRFILMPKRNQIIDHINGNGLDNRRKNIRICTAKENQRNLKKHRDGHLFGTTLKKDHKNNPWKAQICLKDSPKQTYLGYYPTEELAHEAVLLALSVQLL